MSSMQDYEVKTGVWGLPSVDETIRIIRHDARHHAGRRLAQQGPAAASVQENMLVIAPGTAQEGFVTRLQDGLLKPDSRAAPAPVSLRKHSGYHEDAWTSTRDHTCQIIKTHLRATLRTSPDTLTGEINALLAKAPILAAINEAASQAATDALGANQRGVRLRMDQAIREFLGESTVRKVLQTFGNNAVLDDVNPALQDNVQKARRICPNAVLLLAKTGWANVADDQNPRARMGQRHEEHPARQHPQADNRQGTPALLPAVRFDHRSQHGLPGSRLADVPETQPQHAPAIPGPVETRETHPAGPGGRRGTHTGRPP